MLRFTDMQAAGYIPMFLSEDDPRPAQEQLDEGYAHGGGVRPFEGFTVTGDFTKPYQVYLKYPGDPQFGEVSRAKLRDETIILFNYSWVGIFQPDGSHVICRMD